MCDRRKRWEEEQQKKKDQFDTAGHHAVSHCSQPSWRIMGPHSSPWMTKLYSLLSGSRSRKSRKEFRACLSKRWEGLHALVSSNQGIPKTEISNNCCRPSTCCSVEGIELIPPLVTKSALKYGKEIFKSPKTAWKQSMPEHTNTILCVRACVSACICISF